MGEEWIVRVEGQEYGPVNMDTLREWQREGRLIPDNPVRRDGDSVWIKAAEIPGIFPVAEIQHPQAMRRSLSQIIVESFRIYRRGFPQFLVLTLVTALPSVCAQLSAPPVDISANAVPDLQTVAAVGFSFLMLLLSLALWPVFIVGIQIMTADLMAARPLRTFELLRRALPFWPRVALLCLFVYGSYFFWTVLPVAAILAIALAGPSLVSFFSCYCCSPFRFGSRRGYSRTFFSGNNSPSLADRTSPTHCGRAKNWGAADAIARGINGRSGAALCWRRFGAPL